MHDNYDLRQEQMNKSSLLSSRKFLATLLDIFTSHVVSNPSLFETLFINVIVISGPICACPKNNVFPFRGITGFYMLACLKTFPNA